MHEFELELDFGLTTLIVSTSSDSSNTSLAKYNTLVVVVTNGSSVVTLRKRQEIVESDWRIGKELRHDPVTESSVLALALEFEFFEVVIISSGSSVYITTTSILTTITS